MDQYENIDQERAHLVAAIARIDRTQDELRTKLREGEIARAFLERILEETRSGSSDRVIATPPIAPEQGIKRSGAVAPRADRPTLKSSAAQDGSAAARVLNLIRDTGRFLHRSEIVAAIARENSPIKEQTLGAALWSLGKSGALVKVRYDGTHNTIHWGLPEWVIEDSMGKRLNDQHAPTGEIAQRFAPEDARFDV